MTLKPSRFLDPKADPVFKKIFGENPEIIKSFLNSVLPLPDGGLIETIEYLHPEQVPRIPTLKNTIVDVKCKDQKGRIFIVEMQLDWTAHFDKRLLFGTSKAFIQQLKKGEDYSSLCPVYGIGIINDTFDSSEDWFHHYRSINVKYPEKVLEGLELIFLELPKFKPSSIMQRKMGVLWLRFLREINEETIDVPQEFIDHPEINKALELAQESSYTLGELETYQKYWDEISIEKTIRNASLEEGRREGLREGHKEGHKEGLMEEKLRIAKLMLKQGLEINSIAKLTQLDSAAIQKLMDLFCFDPEELARNYPSVLL